MDGAVHHSAWPAAPAYQSLCRGGVCQRLLPDGLRLQPTLLLVFGQSSLSRRMVVPKANLGRAAGWLAPSWVASSAMPAMSANSGLQSTNSGLLSISTQEDLVFFRRPAGRASAV